jgi:hypothetical protein
LEFTTPGLQTLDTSALSTLRVFMWGAGAGTEVAGGNPGRDSGAGGYAAGVLDVSSINALSLIVGLGGPNGSTSKCGWLSGVFTENTITRAGAWLVAGGGGRARKHSNSSYKGGAGGGLEGQTSGQGYLGGTQTAGGQNLETWWNGGVPDTGKYAGGYWTGAYNSSAPYGGGSGYARSNASLTETTLTTGVWEVPPETANPEYIAGKAYGGVGSDQPGIDGFIIIYAS